MYLNTDSYFIFSGSRVFETVHGDRNRVVRLECGWRCGGCPDHTVAIWLASVHFVSCMSASGKQRPVWKKLIHMRRRRALPLSSLCLKVTEQCWSTNKYLHPLFSRRTACLGPIVSQNTGVEAGVCPASVWSLECLRSRGWIKVQLTNFIAEWGNDEGVSQASEGVPPTGEGVFPTGEGRQAYQLISSDVLIRLSRLTQISISFSLVKWRCKLKQGTRLPAPNPGSHLEYSNSRVVNVS